jgi:hypothetical protein
MKENIIGKIYKNTIGLDYVVIRYVPEKQKGTEYYYEIEFIKTKTRKISDKRAIKKGSIFDQFNPSKHGVGYLGNISSRVFNKKAYKKWDAMLSRCYNPKFSEYENYGGNGVKVDPRWFSFENFVEDIQLLEGWNKKLFEAGKLQLDKDIKIKNNKLYSRSTCILVTQAENLAYQPSKMRNFVGTSPNGKSYNGYNVNEFARKFKLRARTILKVLHGQFSQHKGWTFKWA